MQEEKTIAVTDMLNALRGQLAHLREGDPVAVTAGHLDLGPDLWLSADPAGQAELSCQPSDAGVTLHLEGGDSGGWAALGMRLPLEALKQARYLGLLVRLSDGDVISFTPTLRYRHPDGVTDVRTPGPVILAGGAREHLSHIPLAPEHLDRATGCELNLFFHNDSFAADFTAIEPLLIF